MSTIAIIPQFATAYSLYAMLMPFKNGFVVSAGCRNSSTRLALFTVFIITKYVSFCETNVTAYGTDL